MQLIRWEEGDGLFSPKLLIVWFYRLLLWAHFRIPSCEFYADEEQVPLHSITYKKAYKEWAGASFA